MSWWIGQKPDREGSCIVYDFDDRELALIGKTIRPWARGKSRRYLWKPKHVTQAIDYVRYGQGDIPEFDD